MRTRKGGQVEKNEKKRKFEEFKAGKEEESDSAEIKVKRRRENPGKENVGKVKKEEEVQIKKN